MPTAMIGKMGDQMLGPTVLLTTTPKAVSAQKAYDAQKAYEHKQLLHSGYHLVHHHQDTLPHMSHGIGTLVLILVIVHVVAISYLLYLFSRPMQIPKRKKSGKDLKPIHCEDEFLRGAGRSVRRATAV